MNKVKLGSLLVDRRIWVRNHLDTDHIRCLVNDLGNGVKFPPLLVDKNTNIIVGGYHRFYAYKEFFGKNYLNEKVEINWVDMPPIEDNLVAWKEAALEDNKHYVARLKYSDRVKVMKEAAEIIGDEYAIQLGIKYLHFTPERAEEALRIILNTLKKADDTKKIPERVQVEIEKGTKKETPKKEEDNIPPLTPAMTKPNYDTGKDIAPGRLRTPKTGLMALINNILDALGKTNIEILTEAEVNGLQELRDAIDGCLQRIA